MYTMEYLLEKYKDKIIVKDKKKELSEVLKDLVDVEEVDYECLLSKHRNVIENSMGLSKGEGDTDKNLHFYKIIRNKKSEMYYEEAEKNNDKLYKLYFDELTVVVIFDDKKGIQQTNSNLLHRDCIIHKGVTKEDIQYKSDYLFHYLSHLSAWDL